MTEPASSRPRSALADAAERLTPLARTAREQQLFDMPGALRLAASDVYSTSPDEAWSKRYMSQGIGPVPDCASAGGFCPMPFTAAQMDQRPAGLAPQPQAAAPMPEPEPTRTAAAPKASGQIGQAIGKPAKRRWFRRSP
jgi:hypothetical protein